MLVLQKYCYPNVTVTVCALTMKVNNLAFMKEILLDVK